jgi:hypothetical protein
VGAALTRHIYHCLKFNDSCDVERAFEASSCSPASAEESLNLAVNLDETFEVMEDSVEEQR